MHPSIDDIERASEAAEAVAIPAYRAYIDPDPATSPHDIVGGMRVYVAGPMTGYEEYNYPAFRAAAADLREKGFFVLSPVELDEEDGYDPTHAPDGFDKPSEYATFLSRDIHKIVDERVEAIVVLPGWEKSGGARTEVAFGQALGLPILEYPKLEEIGEARKDQGEVRITNPDTGGEKGRKPQRYELVPFEGMGEIAEVYAFGAAKYADHNWRRGYAWSLSFGALMRHMAAFWSGEDLDPESGLPHVAHAGFHVLTLLTFMREQRELDDRPTTLLREERS